MTRGKQILEEAKRIIAEAHERGNNEPMVDLAITLSFTLGARWADKNPHWISVEDKLPPKWQWVLCFTKSDGEINTLRYDIYDWKGICFTVSLDDVTHWMPLPQSPKKGGEK